MKHLSKLMLLVLFAVSLVSGAAFAQDAADIPSVTITADAEGLTAPEGLSAGLTTIVYENVGEGPLFPVLLRLNEGTTLDDFMGIMAAGEEANPADAGTLKGALFVMPQQSGEVTYMLEAGEYVLVNFFSEVPQIASFTVADGEMMDTAEPTADVTVGLYDFAFGIPLQIAAGEQTWLIENFGMQWHEMAIFPIDASMTQQDVIAMLSAEDSEMLPMWVWSPSSEGEKAWVSVNLEPGTYAIACFLPDVSEDSQGHVHFQEGMLQIITVAAGE